MIRNYFLSRPISFAEITANTDLHVQVSARVVDGVVYADEDTWIFDGENIVLAKPYNESIGVYDNDRTDILTGYDENVWYKILHEICTKLDVKVMGDGEFQEQALASSRKQDFDKDRAYDQTLTRLGIRHGDNLPTVQVQWEDGSVSTEQVVGEDDVYKYFVPENGRYYAEHEMIM